jgi:hypothetical protein
MNRPYSKAMIMPLHYVGERTVHDVWNFKEFCRSKDSRDQTPGSSGLLHLQYVAVRTLGKLGSVHPNCAVIIARVSLTQRVFLEEVIRMDDRPGYMAL